MIKKLLIIPYFGQYPSFMNQWIANMEYLKPYGYDYLLVGSLKKFEQRIKDKLGIDPCIIHGTGKPWDYRGALGVLFEEEIKGYDYWGHTDFDCVYGDVNKFMPDEELVKYDLWSNHHCYVCGPWTLYKNTEKVNNIFRECDDWKERLEEPQATGWVEQGYSEKVDELHDKGEINRIYTFHQGHDPAIDENITFKDGKLYDAGTEIMMFHFNRRKRIPPNIQEDSL
jgi:hypothetical protein